MFDGLQTGLQIEGFVDFDYDEDLDRKRSIIGLWFKFGGGFVSWMATLQHLVILSTIESEYIAATEAVKETLWLRGLTGDLGFEQAVLNVHHDSISTIHLSKNHQHHERTKHVDIKYHFIRDTIETGLVSLVKVHSNEPN